MLYGNGNNIETIRRNNIIVPGYNASEISYKGFVIGLYWDSFLIKFTYLYKRPASLYSYDR